LLFHGQKIMQTEAEILADQRANLLN